MLYEVITEPREDAEGLEIVLEPELPPVTPQERVEDIAPHMTERCVT